MAEFYDMPAASPTMELGTLVEWKLSEGDSFESGAVVAVVGTDKANMDVEIFDDGVLLKRLIEEGDEVPAGFPIAIWGTDAGEDIGALLEQFQARKAELESGGAAPAPAPEPEAKAPAAPAAAAEKPKAKAAAPRFAPKSVERTWMGKPISKNFSDPPGDVRAATLTDDRVPASPLARKVAADLGVPLTAVKGSGPGGRVTKDDVEAAAERGSTGFVAQAHEDEVVRNSPMRKTIAKRLLESHLENPTFFLTVEYDASGMVALRKQVKAWNPDAKVSYNDIFVMAVAHTLRRSPKINASWGDKAITRHGRVNVGIAVAVDDGLITPVVFDTDQKSLTQISGEIRELAGLARDGKLQPEQYQGSTFCVSNLGMFGIEEFTAIINPPNAAILAVGALQQKPVVVDGQLTVGWRMKVTMTCDHRVIDGALGAEFLKDLRVFVEAPGRMLL